MLEGLTVGLGYMLAHPLTFLFVFGGMVWGVVFGSMPGLTGIIGVALLIPFTYSIGVIESLLMLGSVYVGATFGGCITAILFNTPGSPEAACTSLDGYPLAKKGEGGKALGYALASSAIGGLIGCVVLMLLTPPLARLALGFGPAEYFALAMLGITAISSLGSNSVLKALLSGVLGLAIATVGIDPLTGGSRFTFGNDILLSGIDFVPVIIGMFAISEVLTRFSERVGDKKSLPPAPQVSTPKISWTDLLLVKATMIRSSIIGILIGILPGVGATTASFISYSEAVRWSRTPEKFGKGAYEGVVAPETANSASVGTSLVPLLALGIPGSATTAVMIGGLTIHGVVPGPNLLTQNQELVYAIFIGMILSNIVMITVGLKAIKYMTKILDAPYAIIGPSIVVLCMTGVFALRNNSMDIVTMLIFGGVGFLMRKLQYPIAPMIIGLVLGPIAEVSLRRALLMNGYDWGALFTRPISGLILYVCIASLLYGFYGQYKKFKQSRLQLKTAN